MTYIFNGCKQFKNNYPSRHNRIAEKLKSELKNVVAINKTIRSTLKDIITIAASQTVWNLKPDIVSKHSNEVTIIDIACPYSLYISYIYKEKLDKYCCITSTLVDLGLRCKIEAIVIGSLGAVHEKSLNVLLSCGISKVSA